MTELPADGLALHSTIRANDSGGGTVELALARVPVPDPGPDEVVIRVEAAPINPSDLGVLFGPADVSTVRAAEGEHGPAVVADIPDGLARLVAGRLDQTIPTGNEGAGVVVAAGSSARAQDLVGRTVAVLGGSMYAEYRLSEAKRCLVLAEGTTPAEGASCFVNPLTALGMVETMRLEGHSALVHTAAASNLGQMLQKICTADGVPLVNIVRRVEHGELLRGPGRRACRELEFRHLHDGSDRRPHRHRRHPRFRRHRRGQAGRPDPDCDGGGPVRERPRVQPLRFRDPEAGLHLRRARPQPDGPYPQLRHGPGVSAAGCCPTSCSGSAPRPQTGSASGLPPRSGRPSPQATPIRSPCRRLLTRQRWRFTRSRRPVRSTW